MFKNIDALEKNVSRKVGQWVPVGYDGFSDGNPVYYSWGCSVCGWEHYGGDDSLTPFCPNCGIQMVTDKEV